MKQFNNSMATNKLRQEISVTSGGEAYNASLHATKKKRNPFAEDELSGYKEMKGFRAGHTKDTGGFQYKDLWNVNENYKDGDKVKVTADGNIHFNDIGKVVDYNNGAYTVQFDDDTVGTYQANQLTKPSGEKSFEDKPTLQIDEDSMENKSANEKELERMQKSYEDLAPSQKAFAEMRIKQLKKLVKMEKDSGKALPFLSAGADYKTYIKKHGLNENSEIVPDRIIKFAKKKGIEDAVNQVAQWAGKAGKKIVGGTAIGKNYNTLVLDLTHEGSEIRITNGEEIEVNDQLVYDYESFLQALGEEELNENYSRFKKETVTRSKEQQMHEAMKLVRKKLYEADRAMTYVKTMKEELGLQEYKSHTTKLMERLQVSIAEIYKKYKEIK